MRKEENKEKISYLDSVNNSIYFQKEIYGNFFEEWYYRNIFSKEGFAISIIPGIYSSEAEEFAFIQVRHNKKGTKTFKYKMREVEHSEDPFYIKIGETTFYKDKIDIKIDEENFFMKGMLKFEKIKRISESKLEPNVMGPLSYLNKVKNNKAIISMHHKVKASFVINDDEYNDLEGIGYIEKNWGEEFPEKYIKAVCNNFEGNNASLFLDIETVKMGIFKATTHSCILIEDNKEYKFSKYNMSKVKCRNIYDERYLITFENKENKLEAQIYLGQDNFIDPDINNMIPRNIEEKLDSGIKVKLYDKEGNIIFKDNSDFAGVEILE